MLDKLGGKMEEIYQEKTGADMNGQVYLTEKIIFVFSMLLCFFLYFKLSSYTCCKLLFLCKLLLFNLISMNL